MAITALRKPTLAAWVVNQLARQQRREIDLLLDAGHRLVEAQRSTLEEGERDDLAQARIGQRKAISKLMDGATELLGGRATKTTLSKVAETLRSAAIAPEGRELLARGRLTHEITGTGWDLLETMAGAGEATSPRRKRARTRPSRDSLNAARANLRDAQDKRAAARKRVLDAERDERSATRELDRARTTLDRAREELAATESAVDSAEASLTDLQSDDQ